MTGFSAHDERINGVLALLAAITAHTPALRLLMTVVDEDGDAAAARQAPTATSALWAPKASSSSGPPAVSPRRSPNATALTAESDSTIVASAVVKRSPSSRNCSRR